jgi:hypothetical protein
MRQISIKVFKNIPIFAPTTIIHEIKLIDNR